MGSLGRRIVVAVVAVAGGTVALAAVGTWMASRAILIANVDRELGAWCDRIQEVAPAAPPSSQPPPPRAAAVVQITPSSSATAAAMAPDPPRPGHGDGGRRGRYLWFPGMRGDARTMSQAAAAADRRIIHSSSSLPEGSELAADLASGFSGRSIRDGRLNDGRRVRIATVLAARPRMSMGGGFTFLGVNLGPRFPVPAPPPEAAAAGSEQFLVSQAYDLEPIQAELGRLAWILAALVGVATVLALVAALILRRSLVRPVRALGDSIGGIGPDDLAARLPAETGPAELRGVVARLNDMLARLEAGFRREQSTIASIAHELRNPVAALRSTLEFRLPLAGEDERAALEPCLATVMRMQAMVSNLLLLARIESGTERLQPSACDVAALVVEVGEEWEGQAAVRGMVIAVAPAPALGLDTSPVHLRCILDNLIGNAVAHGTAGGTVEVAVGAEATGCRVCVVNPVAVAIDPARIGQAFQRGDPARSATGHCGLGLALSRRIAGLLGGSLEVTCAEGRFRVELALPLRL